MLSDDDLNRWKYEAERFAEGSGSFPHPEVMAGRVTDLVDELVREREKLAKRVSGSRPIGMESSNMTELLRLATRLVEGMDVVLVDTGHELELVIDFWGNGTKETAPLGVADADRLSSELRAHVRRQLGESRREVSEEVFGSKEG